MRRCLGMKSEDKKIEIDDKYVQDLKKELDQLIKDYEKFIESL
jgi:hypothetical protein